MNEYMFQMLRPLLIAQEYVEDYIIYEGQEVDYNLDVLRNEVFTNQPQGSISRWVFYGFPDLACDLSEAWIDASNVFKNDNPTYIVSREGAIKSNEAVALSISNCLVNFTERYRNRFIDYFFLKKYEQRIVFTGLPKEHERFCNEWKLNIPLLNVENFYQLAQAISACKFYLGNASMGFQIAEGLKIPRILETFQMMPNVIPIGKDAYDFYSQKAVEYYVNYLFNKTI